MKAEYLISTNVKHNHLSFLCVWRAVLEVLLLALEKKKVMEEKVKEGEEGKGVGYMPSLYYLKYIEHLIHKLYGRKYLRPADNKENT